MADGDSPVSVVMARAASLITETSRTGLDSIPVCSTPLTTCAIRNWSRWIRCRSEPRPMSSLVRQKDSAVTPLMWCIPAVSRSPDIGLSTGNGTHTLTPPRSLMTCTKPLKLSSMK